MIIAGNVRYERTEHMLYHEFVDYDSEGYFFHTPGCSNVDRSGMCGGHAMNELAFLWTYCGGVMPPIYYEERRDYGSKKKRYQKLCTR